MRYSIIHRCFMRPEIFRRGELPEALLLAAELGEGAYVFDWYTFTRIEVEPSVKLAIGT